MFRFGPLCALFALGAVSAARGDGVWPPGSEGLTRYYLRQGTGFETASTSSLSGIGSPWGWATEREATACDVAGMTTAGVYIVQPGSGYVRTIDGQSGTYAETKDWASPADTILGIESNATFEIKEKLGTPGTLTLNNLYIRGQGSLVFNTGVANATTTVRGDWTCERGSTVALTCADGSATDSRTTDLAATLTGFGRVVSYQADSNAGLGDRVQKISGDLTAFAGDISVRRTYGTHAYVLEIVNERSIPKDDPDVSTQVTVADGATLRVDVDWDSGTNRTWEFGSGDVPTVEVASGKTVTIRGAVSGAVGLEKTGAGTLVLTNAATAASIVLAGTQTLSAEDLQAYIEGTSDFNCWADEITGTYYYTGAAFTPPVTVRDFSGNALATNEYDVVYEDNVNAGTACAVITARAPWAGTFKRYFTIFARYYLLASSGTSPYEASLSSSLSGVGDPWGWATTRGSGRMLLGIAENGAYDVCTDSGCVRTPDGANDWTSPTSSIIDVEPDALFAIRIKLANNATLKLNNLTLYERAVLRADVGTLSGTNTLAGDFSCAEGSRVELAYQATEANDARQLTLAATLTGTGAVCAYPMIARANQNERVARITGNLSAFSGDICVYDPFNEPPFTLEIASARSLPKDDADEPAGVTVTNGATLKVDVDWDSGASRTWDFGSGGVPTVEVAAGKTVTVRGPVTGSVGLYKTGAGTLILANAAADPITLTGTASLSAAALQDYAGRITRNTCQADEITGFYHHTGAALAPAVTVRDREGNVLSAANYDVVYSNNVEVGTAYVLITAREPWVGAFVRTFAVHEAYYLCKASGFEPSYSSSLAGLDSAFGNCWGWAKTRDGSRETTGMVDNAACIVQPGSGKVRTPDSTDASASGNENWSSPSGAHIEVEPGALFAIKLKSANNGYLTLNNLVLEERSTLELIPSNPGYVFLVWGRWTCAASSRILLPFNDCTAGDVRQVTLGATISGRGEICACPDNAAADAGALLHKIMRGLSAFTGDLRVYQATGMQSSLTLELEGDDAIPKDDAAIPTHVTVTNGATLKVDADWNSGASRTWDFGGGEVPTVEVADGKTVTIRGAVLGTVGLKKTGAGTLVLAHAGVTPVTLEGSATMSAAELKAYIKLTRRGTCMFVQ